MDRRIRLTELAKQILLPADFEILVTSSPGLLDRNYGEVYQKIRDAGHSVPCALNAPSGHTTVFHTLYLTSDEMEALYRAGFRDIDSLDDNQRTPLMLQAIFKPSISADDFHWLISKGANPLRIVDACGVSQISYVAMALSSWASHFFLHLHGHAIDPYSDTHVIRRSPWWHRLSNFSVGTPTQRVLMFANVGFLKARAHHSAYSYIKAGG